MSYSLLGVSLASRGRIGWGTCSSVGGVLALPNMREALESDPPALYKPGVVAPSCHPSTPEVETGRSGVLGHSQMHSELEVSLTYVRPCLKENQIKTK